LDKNEEKERGMKDRIASKNIDAVLPVAQDRTEGLKELLDTMEKSREYALSQVRKDAKSIFSNKRNLAYIELLIQLSHDTSRMGLVTYFSADYLNRKINILEKALTIAFNQITDLPRPEDMKKMREMATRMTELDALMKKLKEMTDQAEMEKANTFKKRDMARQQVLKGVV
jgi:hypothetical protein